MHVEQSERVATVLMTMGHEERQKVAAWFDYFRNWEENKFVQTHSAELNIRGQKVFVFRTSTDVRIFYTVDLPNKTITIVDVTTKDTILTSGGVPAGSS